MATGRKNVFSGDSVKGSVSDFTCTPCSKDGQYVEAINYCSQCAEYFCPTCTKHHKKFGATSDHSVVNRTLAKRPGDVPPSPVVRETCRGHHGERLTTYCADHDLVVCRTCVAVDHGLCGGVSYIPKVAGGAKQSKHIDKVKQQISASLKTNDQTKVSLQRRLASADQEKADHHKHIHDYTERMIKHARDLEKAAHVDVDNHHDKATKKLRSDIKSIDDASTIMNTRLASLNNANTNSDAQIFVDVKLGPQEVESARQLQQNVTPSAARKVLPEFVVGENIDHFLTEVRSLGEFIARGQLIALSQFENKAFRAELLGQYKVHMPQDQHKCAIADSCELHDGAILFADSTNECLKKLSKSSYEVTERLDMPADLSCICRISDYEVAVTLFLKKKVQFVNLAGGLRLTRSFKVGGQCCGIVCSRGEFFVVCGAYKGYKVEVYDMSGSPLRTIQFDNRGRQLFSWPRRITASASGDKLHISDHERGVITMDRQGRVLSTFSHDVLPRPGGICTVTGDNILVCGFDSDNVVQLGPDGERVAELLTGKDGIKHPVSVRPIRDNTRLILTEGESNTIKIYSLKS